MDVDTKKDGSHFSRQSVFSGGTPPRTIDTPEVSDRDALVRDSKQGEKPGETWDDGAGEEYYSADEK